VDAVEEVQIRALANGGEGVGRLADGCTVFVAGALPGETVQVEPVERRRRHARGRLVAVLAPSPDRVEPPCHWQRAGCGSCDLMAMRPAAQHAAKVQLAREALQRLGRLADPLVAAGPTLPSEGVRTTIRVAVDGGRAAYRRRASHELLAVDDCLIAHPGLASLLATGRFGRAREATLRIGAATGERMVVLDPAGGDIDLPPDVAIVDAADLRPGGPGARAAVHEVVAGRRWRISAGSFFQTSAVGAEALVAAVATAARPRPGAAAPRRVLDAYSGVGLLSAALPAEAELITVESNPSSVADAVVNLADRDVEVVQARFERWRPRPVELAVADPARRGLGRGAAEVLAATGAAVVVLVSCDLAALGRDSADLVALGYDHAGSTVLDLFPHTSHAEVVTRFERR